MLDKKLTTGELVTLKAHWFSTKLISYLVFSLHYANPI
jgi:hypothetical protein